MSQFDPYGEPAAGAGQAPTTSKLAITALVCSLIFFCPITTLLGPLLGLIAIPSIGSNPAKKGKGLAIAAILIGVVFSGLWFWVGSKGVSWVKQSMAVVTEGPGGALQAGFGGDMAGFKAEFHGAGAAASDAEVTAFIETLRSRYGEYVSTDFSQQQNQSPQPGQPEATFEYTVQFDQGSVDAEALIIFADQSTGQFIMRLGEVRIIDPDAGDVVFPASP